MPPPAPLSPPGPDSSLQQHGKSLLHPSVSARADSSLAGDKGLYGSVSLGGSVLGREQQGGARLAPDLLLTRGSLAWQNGRGGRGIERKKKKREKIKKKGWDKKIKGIPAGPVCGGTAQARWWVGRGHPAAPSPLPARCVRTGISTLILNKDLKPFRSRSLLAAINFE